MVSEKIENLIERVLKKTFPKLKVFQYSLFPSKEEQFGDWSTNLAILLAKKLKQKPQEIAKRFIENLLSEKESQIFFEKIEFKEPGFINFFLSSPFLREQILEILKKKERFGSLEPKKKKVQVEFISANPTGPLTVGNSRGGPFGETLSRVLEKAGFKVKRAYYINDYGMQILALGHSVLNTDKAQYKGKYIEELRKRIKEKDPYKAGERAAKIILKEMIKNTVKKLGIKFDEWISESELHKKNYVEKVLKILKKKNLLYEKEGAIWFKSKQLGDNRDRVLVKKNGWKTYLAGDLALHYFKFKEKKYDKVIDVFGADHAGDVPALKAGVAALGFPGKLEAILLQFVTLFEKKERLKMSKRSGVFVTMDELLKKIPPDVVKFFFLEKSAQTHLNFDLDLARERSEKNPVYYVQYAHARICSILKKARLKNPKIKDKETLNSLNHPSELRLIKQLIKFPEMIKEISMNYQVQRITRYAIELASLFHQFYQNCQVLSEDKDLKRARLALILATKEVIKNTLDLMGISAPTKM